LRFCLSYPAVSAVIPGLMNVREVEEDAATSALGPFPPAALAELERCYRESELS
jgi:aryl-alcohol dehydrogenase-like predicted oxidoreductase